LSLPGTAVGSDAGSCGGMSVCGAGRSSAIGRCLSHFDGRLPAQVARAPTLPVPSATYPKAMRPRSADGPCAASRIDRRPVLSRANRTGGSAAAGLDA